MSASASPTARSVTLLLARLAAAYPDATCSLTHRNPFELLIATILSAQCTDVRVNIVCQSLFARCPDAASLDAIALADLEEIIRPTGFYKNKARALKGAARLLVERHGGVVPADSEQLIELPGVAQKTANVVLGSGFGIAHGIVVDTHVKRLSARLGLTRHKDPAKIEADLVKLIPRARWIRLSHELIDHGRAVCTARAPACDRCTLRDLCPTGLAATPA